MIGRTDARQPYFQNFQFSIQQELLNGLLLEASYVGVKGTRLGTGLFNINEVDPQYLSLGSTLSQNITSPAAVAAGISAPYAGFRGSVAQALRPYPQYLNVSNNSNPNGNSTYHALQTKIERRYARGLTLLAAYTWAKTISDGDIAAGGGPSGQTFYNRGLEKAVSTNDVPHVVAISYTYELPFGPGKPFMNGEVLPAGSWVDGRSPAFSSTRPAGLSRLRPTIHFRYSTARCARMQSRESRNASLPPIRSPVSGSTRPPLRSRLDCGSERRSRLHGSARACVP